MTHILISIASSGQREDLLRGAVSSVVDLVRPAEVHIELLVVDNSTNGFHELLVSGLKRLCEGKTELILVRETKSGIPFARNKAVSYARESSADWLVFFDDDAYMSPDWLIEFEAIRNAGQPCIITGPQIPVFNEQASEDFSNCLIYKERFLNEGETTEWAATNNVAIKVSVLAERNLFFSEDMLTGGSDKEFFLRLTRNGIKIRWSNKIKVYEHVLPQRLNEQWISDRSLRIGLTERRILAGIYHPLKARCLCFMKGGYYLLLCVLSYVAKGKNDYSHFNRTVYWKRCVGLFTSAFTARELSGYV